MGIDRFLSLSLNVSGQQGLGDRNLSKGTSHQTSIPLELLPGMRSCPGYSNQVMGRSLQKLLRKKTVTEGKGSAAHVTVLGAKPVLAYFRRS